MSNPSLPAGFALMVAAMVLAAAGCSSPTMRPANSMPPNTRPGPTQTADSPLGSAQASDANTNGDAPPDPNGHPACPAYDSWRPDPGGAGITVTYWYEGTDPITVLVRHPEGPDLSQTVDNDVQVRYRDFEFLDADPAAVTDVIITTGDTTCYARFAPS